MPTQDIFIVRHGRTFYNEQGIVQGSGIDASLNETGLEQARAFFEAYQNYPFDRIYTSKLKRTHETVSPFLAKGIAQVQHGGLNEISWGDYEGLKVWEVDHSYYRNLLEQWNQGHTHIPIQGGESPECVAERQQAFIRALRQRSQDRQVLVCMHGRAMRVLLCQLLQEPLSQMDKYPHSNLSLYHIRLSEQKAELVKADCREHLKQQSPHDA